VSGVSVNVTLLEAAANDNAGERPVIRTPARRPDARYACAANVLLPLRFAQRMPEWRATGKAGRRAAAPPPSARPH
jgi:hypothetical protein